MTNAFAKLNIPTEASMLAIGAKLAKAAGDTAIIFLCGPLGAGKTTFSRGFLRGLGYPGHVKSPTYTIVEPYQLNTGTLNHFDFYRVKDARELEYIGIQDYFVPQAICLIEWPENGKSVLPIPDVSCYIDFNPPGREIKMIAQSARGETILRRFEYDE